MFKELTIEHLRGIKHLKLDALTQVNVFLGRNNCGKSTVLDGIFLLSGMSNPALGLLINQMRDYRQTDSEDLLLNFYQLNPKQPIHLRSKFNDIWRDLKILPHVSDGSTVTIETTDPANLSSLAVRKHDGFDLNFTVQEGDKPEERYGTSITFSDEKANPPIDKSGFRFGGVIGVTRTYHDFLRAIYINPMIAFQTSVKRLENIINNKQEKEIVDILSAIEPRIQDITVVDSTIKVDIGLDKLVPINMLGDGIRRLMAIVVTMHECKDGVILIDEIDNGLHYSSMPTLWKAVLDTARRYNIQVFATTHSKDSLIALRETLVDDANADMRDKTASYTLRRLPDDGLKAYKYDYEKLDFAINQDIEMR